jgi:t-SNARE complex subunit (syntaxin)
VPDTDPSRTPRAVADEALREAEARGREAAQIRAEVAEHGRHFKRLNTSLDKLDVRLEKLTGKIDCVEEKVDTLSTAFQKYVAVAKAVAEAAKAVADKAVTTRTFVLGVLGLALVIVGYLGLGH